MSFTLSPIFNFLAELVWIIEILCEFLDKDYLVFRSVPFVECSFEILITTWPRIISKLMKQISLYSFLVIIFWGFSPRFYPNSIIGVLTSSLSCLTNY